MERTPNRPRLSDADILTALRDNNNVRRYAARSLGLSESVLGNRLHRMQKAGVHVPRSARRRTPCVGRQQANGGHPPPVISAEQPRADAPGSPDHRRRTLAEILAFDSKLAAHPLLDAAIQGERRQAERRRIEIHEAWWRTRVEVVDFPPPVEMGEGIFRQILVIDINQRLARGEIERIFALGVRAMHEARGEVAGEFQGVRLREARLR
jgi:hypothetical protein